VCPPRPLANFAFVEVIVIFPEVGRFPLAEGTFLGRQRYHHRSIALAHLTLLKVVFAPPEVGSLAAAELAFLRPVVDNCLSHVLLVALSHSIAL